MLMTARGPYHDPESTSTKWILIFVMSSLIAHAIIIAAILLITVFMPPPKLATVKPDTSVTLELAAPPPPPPLQHPQFIPTNPAANVPHKQQLIESANDRTLTSTARKATKPDSVMPEVNGHPHSTSLNDSQLVQAPPTPRPSTTPPRPKQDKTKPTPTPPKPQQGTQAPSPQMAKPQPRPPQKPVAQPPQVDPLTGLPVLPPLNVPTMAPPDSSAPTTAAPSPEQIAASVHGAISGSGDNSPAAMATDLGKYKQYLYAVVGSYWYPDVKNSMSLISVGVVRIRATIHSDGRITDVTVLEGDNLEILRGISRHALVAPAPYKPFSDALIKQVGENYTDEFSFTIYSNN
jgi:outer membrane biosynthesis protein TonB